MTKNKRLVVCILDDAQSVRKSIGAVLQTADIQVRDYGSAAQFLNEFSPGDASCLILDQYMPGMTGLELLTHLRRAGIGVPVIVITGKGDPALEEKVLQAGAVAMLHKPVDGEALIALIESAVRDQPVSRDISASDNS